MHYELVQSLIVSQLLRRLRLIKLKYSGLNYHSDLATCGSSGRRWPSKLRTARASAVLWSDNLKHLDLMSPTAGPPKKSTNFDRKLAMRISIKQSSSLKRGDQNQEKEKPSKTLPSTRTISAVLPPSSETGRTWATRVVRFFSSSATPLNAVPPEQ